MAEALLIGEVARMAGVTVKAVRHYHRQRLLPEPPREPNGYRAYSPEHLVVLVRIRKLREAGLSLAAIRELMSKGPTDDPLRQLEELLGELEAERETLDERLVALRTLVDGLGRGDDIDTSDLSPSSYMKAEPSLKRLGATPRLLDAERRMWALLDGVSWAPGTAEGIQRGFQALTADKTWGREVATKLDAILQEVDAGANAEELVPLVEELVGGFPPRGEARASGGSEQQVMSALVMTALPKPFADALRVVAARMDR